MPKLDELRRGLLTPSPVEPRLLPRQPKRHAGTMTWTPKLSVKEFWRWLRASTLELDQGTATIYYAVGDGGACYTFVSKAVTEGGADWWPGENENSKAATSGLGELTFDWAFPRQ